MAEKWRRSRAAADVDRSSAGVDRSTNEPSANARGGKKGEKEREKVMGDGG